MADHQLAYRLREKQSRILTIAFEICDNIISHLLPTDLENKHHPKGLGGRSSSAEHSLLLVNKQISKEYLDVICRDALHTITIDRKRGKQKGFAVAVSPYMRIRIGYLRVACEHSTRWSDEATGVVGLSSDIGRPRELLKRYAPGDKTVILHHLSKLLSSFTRLQKATLAWECIDWHPEYEVEVSMSTMKALPETSHYFLCTRRQFDMEYEAVSVQFNRPGPNGEWLRYHGPIWRTQHDAIRRV